MLNINRLFLAFQPTKLTNLFANRSSNSLLKYVPLAQSSYKQYSTGFSGQPSTLLQNSTLVDISNSINSRSVTKFSIKKGKRKTVKTVLMRFYRLNWGGWVRTIAGRHRRMWSKSYPRQVRVRQHVLCNSTQCTLLDKMVTNYWRKPKYYVEDPYEPYHTREEFEFTARKPRAYFPPE
ncbi:hypothetical protein PPYR_11687 [Photinus pyralis]|uniref:Large ribosomal subunit protein bL35m n=1 Tax=Photinus pyralis TaxID=7054 RepID=A0A1Y1NJ65_PHOPY|nr:hypothetical protein PPYR_11687 [Photinus pyralis]